MTQATDATSGMTSQSEPQREPPMSATPPCTDALASRMAEAQLPGDAAMSPAQLETAAAFMAAAGLRRAARETVVALGDVPASDQPAATCIAVINEDMPFLVDSIAAAVSAQGHAIDRLLHPVVPARRDEAGALLALDGDALESMIYIEVPAIDPAGRERLAAAIELTLGDVRAATSDWPAMQAAMAIDATRLADLGRSEGAALLAWLGGGMLTQLGHVMRRRDGSQAHALGVCRQSSWELLSPASFERAFAWFDARYGGGVGDRTERLPLIVKSNRFALVHRRVPLDLFIVPVIEEGRVAALSVHAGVWTSAALATPPQQIPRLRAQLAALMAKFGFAPEGHAGKALVHVLTKLPHDLLIGFSDAEVERIAAALMALIDRPRPRLALVEAPLARHIYAFVWLPRDAFTSALRREVAAMLESASGARAIDWTIEVESNALAELRFTLDLREASVFKPDEAALDARLRAMVRGWGEAVAAELAASAEARASGVASSDFITAFPLAYRSIYGPGEAATDIVRLLRVAPDRASALPHYGVRLYQLASDGPERLRLKLYQRHGALTLSGAVPALENFGFRVIDDVQTTLKAQGEPIGSIHDFLLALPAGTNIAELLAHRPLLEEALAAVANATGEDDAFNRLIARVGLSAREANWLRAWYRYLRQTGLGYGVETAVDALCAAPQVTLGLIDLFRARLQPGIDNRAPVEAEAEAAIRDGLAGVTAINDDRLLRAFRAVVLAMLRTNAFAPALIAVPGHGPVGENERPVALAFKFDSALVPGLPKPVPYREIFVYSSRVEGIHLRAGPVARGGLRWSDRRDDYRTEILGLMKAQRVKNAVIVPTGAKGGFYPKRLPDPAKNRDAWATEGRESYRIFIRSLLSITDNIVDNAVVHPAGVHVRDREDPYFVVAADKGTATFSDTANALAAETDFWLDDAFASGGSKGYDHKAMGITAKGAWISIQRHFRELGVDVQSDPVRVVGVGDMSGDVFGNGMLLSQSIRLVAAFDHRHIFLDPSPDAAASWAERARLFALPRSSWADYDTSLISAGGGVFPRSQKEIPLSPEVRLALGLTAETADPDALMRAILAAPVDLLWFGGIGTYVKATGEANAAVGDHANDTIRVDGREVRARVIGEGGNLGCTQAGRIEFGLQGAGGKGGRDNPDFIDNSAGVDCSDKEVNIKIALASAKRAGRLDEDGRVALLTSMTDDVSALVLEDNRLQALALSIAEAGGVAAVPAAMRLIEVLEDAGGLDAATEGLADAETFARRAAEGRGLTRPELAVLLSSAKLALQEALEQSAVVEDPGLEDDLFASFPPGMRAPHAEDIRAHRLRREIIATRLANRLINRLGCMHPFELAEEEGASLADVAAAFVAAERLLGLDPIWQAIETEPMSEVARIALFVQAAAAVRAHMADLLRAGAARTAPSALAAELAPAVSALMDGLDELLVAEARAQSARIGAALAEAGAPPAQATAVTRLHASDGVVGLARLAGGDGARAGALARAFTLLGERLGLDWAQGAAARLSPSDPWERLLVAGLARDFQQMRLQFLARHHAGEGDAAVAVEAWLGAQGNAVARFRGMIGRARVLPVPTPAMLAQIASQARNLLVR